uniref:RING-type E3 ubiquitin transferase n=1 Tax=Latimeria chalumnae TaxID=7897 RepID=H3B381_LATCH
MSLIGVRVVRGPSWKWQDQDGGEGHLGTITDISEQGSAHGKAAIVQWDCGECRKYRIGVSNNYDLLLYDNASTGVHHVHVTCDGCNHIGIWGIRWKCVQCHNFDLCSICYMSDKHNIGHSFHRILTPSSQGVAVPPRQNSKKIQAKGIFVDATVRRGKDWKWGNQDQAKGNPGKVAAVRGWNSTAINNAATVIWSNRYRNNYRLGFGGMVDLKCTNPATGGFYYKDHLPKLGETAVIAKSTFKKGDKVKCKIFQTQQMHLGLLSELLTPIGQVKSVTTEGDIVVQYGNSNEVQYKPENIIRFYEVGDYVKIIEDLETVKKLQSGHGGWAEGMRQTLGHIGQVIKVLPKGDLKVSIGGSTWTYNPACVYTADPSEVQKEMNTNSDENDEASGGTFVFVKTKTFNFDVDHDDPVQLVIAAAKGNMDEVKELVHKFPSKVDIKHKGKTALHVASHQGHTEIVKILLEAKTDMKIKDDNEDTALHFAAYGNEHEVANMLLRNGALANSVNAANQTPLHIAAQKGYTSVARVLCDNKCDVNIQDSDGNTPMHIAVDHDFEEIIDCLSSMKNRNYSLANHSGYNPLHTAAVKGSKLGVQRIIARAANLVDEKKEDGFSALHLAAYNGHTDVVKVLIKEGRCNINALNNRGQTAFMLAVSRGHADTAFLMVRENCNINVEDEDGNTALHLLFRNQELFSEAKYQLEPDSTLLDILNDTGLIANKTIYVGEALAYFLAKEGADLHHSNNRGRKPLDYLKNDIILNTVKSFAKAYR